MKIIDMRVHSIAIADPPLRSSYGLHAPYALRTILELESDDGITGISETYGGEVPARALEAIRPDVIGQNPYRLTGLLSSMTEGAGSGIERSQTYLVPGENPLDQTTRTYAAVETGCLDLIGKSVGQGICDLIGGRVRDKVAFSAYPFFKHGGGGGEGDDLREDEYGEVMTPEALVREVKQMIARYGFGSVKFKGGVLEPDLEIEAVKLLYHQFGPDVPLRIDPNSAWTVETSVRVGRELAKELSGGGYLEDPTASIENMSQVRKRLMAEGIETPLATNVAVTSFADIPQALELDAVQIILCDHHYWGGMRTVQRLAGLCKVFDIGLSMHSNSHLGVSLMAMAHVAAATPHLTYACDTHYPWQSDKDEIVAGGRVPIVDGCVAIGDKPGLGVELDYDQLARGRERFEKCPYRKRDDEAQMRARRGKLETEAAEMVIKPGQNLEDYVVILSDKDNVATALVDLPAGDYMLGSGADEAAISVPEDIRAGFKLALSDIAKGEQIYKYGYLIGLATEDIAKGDCVHVHNLISSV